jgi:hypothetical protein
MIPQIDKFPRLRRFTLGERLESTLLEVLELTVQAAFTHDKRASLQQANLRMEVKSWISHACDADTLALRESIFSRIVFT